jgi:hypothetical protein
MVVDVPVALLVEHFPYLTKKQLLLVGQNHAIDFMSGGRKEVYRHLLLTHTCTPTCTRTPFVFRQRAHARLDASKPSYPSSDDLGRHRRRFIESRRHQQHERRLALKKEAVHAKLSSFPPELTTAERDIIISEWIDEMDLNRFIQNLVQCVDSAVVPRTSN